ncbi:hypothetical protein PIB30_100540, partial [Stylosanthes scabra]|nr:hypothetical protein [Stylosanthes scabra]
RCLHTLEPTQPYPAPTPHISKPHPFPMPRHDTPRLGTQTQTPITRAAHTHPIRATLRIHSATPRHDYPTPSCCPDTHPIRPYSTHVLHHFIHPRLGVGHHA